MGMLPNCVLPQVPVSAPDVLLKELSAEVCSASAFWEICARAYMPLGQLLYLEGHTCEAASVHGQGL